MNDMHDDWLWDKRGAPDPELARIERALGAFRMQVTATPLLPRRPAQLARTLLAAAAIVSTAVGLALVHVAGAPAGPSPYSVESIAGRVAVQDPSGRARGDEARPGDVVSTDADSRARIRVGGIGSVELWPGSELAIAADGPHSDADGYRLDLVKGTLEASIFAAPRLFQVGTPSGIAVDLGCIYTATVEPGGNTRLAVRLGRVSFEAEGHRVLVPSRAECLATPATGPGTPFWSDKDEQFRAAVIAIDRGENVAASLGVVLASKDERDALTWFHLLQRVAAPDRGRIVKHVDEVIALPKDLRLDLVAAGDPTATAALKDALDPNW